MNVYAYEHSKHREGVGVGKKGGTSVICSKIKMKKKRNETKNLCPKYIEHSYKDKKPQK